MSAPEIIAENLSLEKYRFGAVIEYSGQDFYGFQRQRIGQLPTIESELCKALSRVANAPITIACAGRTDKGVHALHQVIHFDAPVWRDPEQWRRGANSYLHSRIYIREVALLSQSFHARFSAKSRDYTYLVIFNQDGKGLLQEYAYYFAACCDLLAWDQLFAALEFLKGEHDFSAFRGKDCQAKSPIRTLMHASVRLRDKCLYFDFRANGFLHHMVRNIVGTLLDLLTGRFSFMDFQALFKDHRHRKYAGHMAPAAGLYLTGVHYASDPFISFSSSLPFLNL